MMDQEPSRCIPMACALVLTCTYPTFLRARWSDSVCKLWAGRDTFTFLLFADFGESGGRTTGLRVVFASYKVMRHSLLHYERTSFPASSLSRPGPEAVQGRRNYALQVQHAHQMVQMFLLDGIGGRVEQKYTGRQRE